MEAEIFPQAFKKNSCQKVDGMCDIADLSRPLFTSKPIVILKHLLQSPDIIVKSITFEVFAVKLQHCIIQEDLDTE